MFFNYLFFNYLSYYLYMYPEWSKSRGGMYPEWSKIGFANVPRMVVENSTESHKPVEIGDLRDQGDSRSGETEGPGRPAEAVTGR